MYTVHILLHHYMLYMNEIAIFGALHIFDIIDIVQYVQQKMT
jgi:hypothetical protein